MPHRDPNIWLILSENLSNILAYIWVFFLSSMGGIANYVRKVKMKIVERVSIVELIGELFISAFSGLITYFLCVSAGIDEFLMAALVGVSGHMGSRVIFIFEELFKQKFNIRKDFDSIQAQKNMDEYELHKKNAVDAKTTSNERMDDDKNE